MVITGPGGEAGTVNSVGDGRPGLPESFTLGIHHIMKSVRVEKDGKSVLSNNYSGHNRL